MLPKIDHPMYDFIIPSTNKKEYFRPYLGKEEKILLMAKSTNDNLEIFKSIKQVINRCAVSDDFDVDALTTFDIEYLFIKLRAISVNNMVEVSYRDTEDQQVYKFSINLDDIKVNFPNQDKIIKVPGHNIGLVMKYAPATLFDDKVFSKSDNPYFELVLNCVHQVFDEETVYENFTKEDLEGFLDTLPVMTHKKIAEFMENMPTVSYTIEYKNSLGNDRKIELRTLTDFFTLG